MQDLGFLNKTQQQIPDEWKSWHDLLNMRTQNPMDDRLAGLEHRAWAREEVQKNPLNAVAQAFLVPGYQGYKLLTGNPKATPPSVNQLRQGYTGILEGLAEHFVPKSDLYKKPYPDEHPRDSIKASPRDTILGLLADIMGGAKSFADKAQVPDIVPLLGGKGLGEILMGGTPELIEDTAYYGPSAFIKGGNRATGGLGTYKLDPRVADMGMVAADLYVPSKVASKGIGKLPSIPHSASRREFLKKSGAAGLAAATGGVLLKGGKEIAEALPKVADNTAIAAVKQPFKYNNLKEYFQGLLDSATDVFNKNSRITSPNYRPLREIVSDHMAEAEMLYDDAKHFSKIKNKGDFIDNNAYFPDELMGDYAEFIKRGDFLNDFSPLAKKQMKEFKTNYKNKYDVTDERNLIYDRSFHDDKLYSEIMDYMNR